MKTTTLRLPDELHEKLRREAFEKETSINKLILSKLYDSKSKKNG